MVVSLKEIRNKRNLLDIRAKKRAKLFCNFKTEEDVCTENENFELLKDAVYQQIIRSDEFEAR